MDLPQSYMEPILVKYAYLHGFAVRYSSQLQSAEKDSTGEWLCTVKDHVREDTYTSEPSLVVCVIYSPGANRLQTGGECLTRRGEEID